MVFDVGVRRVRFDGRGVRGRYTALRERIGGVEVSLPRQPAMRAPVQVPMVSKTQSSHSRPVAAAPTPADRGSRLLAARQRARRG
jgi:hypothetical protein